MLYNIFLSLLLTLSFVVRSQTYQTIDYIKTTKGAKTFSYPWMGGLLAPVISKGDINFDGRDDVVVYDLNSGFFHGFIYTESGSGAKYVYNKNATSNFPPIIDWFLLRDYNCDGIVDLFTYGPPGSIAVYKGENISGELHFKKRYPELRHGNVAIYNVPTDYPAIADLDGDGDLDILSFNVSGTRVSYYKNLRADLGLPCDSLVFERVTRCWGGFEEGFFDEDITLNACNPALRTDEILGIMHVGGSVTVIDKNKNGLFDAIVGDVESPFLTYLVNGGTKDQAFMISKDVQFPSNNIPVNLLINPMTAVMDVNRDGWDDLLISPFEFTGTENYNNTWYYKNTGTTGGFNFQLQTKSFITEHMLDFGQLSVPALGDLDGDGKVDLLVGNGGLRKGKDTLIYNLVWLKNTGTVDTPQFNVVQSDFLQFSLLDYRNLAPDLKDMDGDGDLDLVIGLNDGTLIYFSNEGNTSNPNFIFRGKLKDNLGNDIVAGTNTLPEIYDVDKDGLPDLIVGNRTGKLFYFKNLGFTSGEPRFELINNQVGNISFPNTSISAEIFDVNNDGKDDLLLSGVGDSVLLYLNFEDNWQGSLSPQPRAFIKNLKHRNIALSSAKLSNGEGLDIIAGTGGGGLLYLSSNLEPITSILTNVFETLNVYPNPILNRVYIDLKEPLSNNFKLTVYDVLGKEFYPQSIKLEGNRLQIHFESLSFGIYFIQILDNQKGYIAKFLKH